MDVDSESAEPGVLAVVLVTVVPAVCMALGSLAIGVSGEPSERMEARLQHFSGGLLIGAVITDIFPILKQRLVVGAEVPGGRPQVEWSNALAGVLGFLAALAVMHGVKGLALEELELGETAAPPAPPGGAEKCCRPSLVDVMEEAICPVNPPASVGGGGLSKPLLEGASSQEGRGLKRAIDRLVAQAGALGQITKDEEIDREAVDEEVHSLDFLMDVVRRRCQSDTTEAIDPCCVPRLRMYVGDLNDHVTSARCIDLSDLPALDAQLQVVATTLRRVHVSAESRTAFRRWAPRPHDASPHCIGSPVQWSRQSSLESHVPGGAASPEHLAMPVASMPWGLVLAVLIDSTVDGMLIGLAGAVALQSGWLMAMATAVEMGFLGYSFACSVAEPAARRGGLLLKSVVLTLPPVAMVVAASVAASCAAIVEGKPAFVGLMAFALAALLFLVVEELLLEAHEKEGNEEWHVCVWLYVGLFISICLDVTF